ncbi:uncharacterized protein [Ptychodera flava]|uniref:uncharacterized protein n=1 Tax=Ptychodera flava TaxID=63121 RepID=UPI00396A7607
MLSKICDGNSDFSITAKVVLGSKNAKIKATLGSLNIVYKGSHLSLLEDGIIKVGNRDVTDLIQLGIFKDFANGAFRLRWDLLNISQRRIRVDVGDVLTIFYNGNGNLVIGILDESLRSNLCGLLGNFNGKVDDDLMYLIDGVWKTANPDIDIEVEEFVKAWKTEC